MMKTLRIVSASLVSALLCGSPSVASEDAAALAAETMAVLASARVVDMPDVPKVRPVLRKSEAQRAQPVAIRPKPRPYLLPKTRWEHRPGHTKWTRAGMQAVLGHGRALVRMVPRDYREWCPAYAENDAHRRAMFWVGFMSALAKHESTYRQDAVGGGGKWYGLLQILPDTARRYGCKAKTGAALKDGALNLSCAARIMAVAVPRDGVVHGVYPDRKRKYHGITADWGPMHSRAKRTDMMQWMRQQSYCKTRRSLRPVLRPVVEASLAQE